MPKGEDKEEEGDNDNDNGDNNAELELLVRREQEEYIDIHGPLINNATICGLSKSSLSS